MQHLCYNCFQEQPEGGGPCPHCGFDLEENVKKYPVALRAGTVLNGRYIVGRVLGQGGFGITYLAWDTKLEAKMAIKEFMPGELATRVDGTTVSVMAESKTEAFTYGAERFQEEARTLAKFIGNPNIAGVSDCFDENDTSYFVMDYIEGISFKTYIANHGGKVSVEDACNVMIPVLRALTAVHAEGFIHRDVTPDNIYITKDGVVKLLDFGSARYSIGDKSKSLDVILKVGYAPKEQYIRRSRQGPYTDVYSCAACFYAAITGYLPPESLERLDKDELVPISQLGIEIPEYLDKAILKGLAVQPEDRFQSAAEFLEAIETRQVVEVSGQAPAAPAPAAKEDLVAKVRKKPVLFGVLAAAVVALVVCLALFTGGSGGGGKDDGPPLKQSAVPAITIAGETYSTDLRELRLQGMGLTDEDIQDLQYMINLTYLDLRENKITDLSPLEPLTELQSLNLRQNEVSDLSPLAGMTHMRDLQLGGGSGSGGNLKVSDLTPLSGMTELQFLSLPPGCEISDLSPLAGLTALTELSFDGSWGNGTVSYISDLSPLANLTNLSALRILVNNLESLEPLANLTELTEMQIYGTYQNCSLSALSGLTKLKSLELSYNSSGNTVSGLTAEDLTALSGLTELTTLRVELSGLKTLKGLENLTKLTNLQLRADNSLSDFSAVSGLTNLKSFRIYNSGNGSPYLADLEDFSGLKELQTMSMSADGLTSLDGLEGLTNLRELELYGSDATYSDVDALSGLTGLRSIYLPSRNYQLPPLDISGIANLTQLESFIYYGGVESYVPFAKLTNLKTLRISGSYYESGGPSDLSALGNLTNLVDLQLTVGYNVKDLSPLASLKQLRTLDLNVDGNYQNYGLTDITPLGQLTGLQSLTLTSYGVTNLSPLRNLTSLQSAEIRCYGQNKITDWSPLDHVPNVVKD